MKRNRFLVLIWDVVDRPRIASAVENTFHKDSVAFFDNVIGGYFIDASNVRAKTATEVALLLGILDPLTQKPLLKAQVISINGSDGSVPVYVRDWFVDHPPYGWGPSKEKNERGGFLEALRGRFGWGRE